MTITEFLEARIAEDEATARGAHYEGQHWYSEEEFVGRYPDCCDCGCEVMMGANRKIEAAHIATWKPARALAECAAKRAILALHDYEWMGPDDAAGKGCEHDYEDWPCPTIRAIAAVYADHPDYDRDWAL